jgi:NTP pyrophosphatase (non-canonical NTP hydrolase)
MNKIAEDYFCYAISPMAQDKPDLLLATSGVLNSVSGRIKLFIKSCTAEFADLNMVENIREFEMVAKLIFDSRDLQDKFDFADSPVEFTAKGSPSQCYQYFASKFEELLSEYNDEIYIQSHPISCLEDFMSSNTSKEIAVNPIELEQLQQSVHSWISSVGINYFNELTNLSNLIEEVGEVARLIGREYGEQSFKPNERPVCVKTAIADELADVMFIVVCLSNQMNINLSDAFTQNMSKKTQRDTQRHINNSALIAKGPAKNE